MTKERGTYVLIAILTGVYVAFRAALVPWVHDECASLFWYVERGVFLPHHGLWEANNHVLNSALGILWYKLGGLHLFGSRIASVLAFVPFAWAVYRLGGHAQQPFIRRNLRLALLLCPFLLDFFGLFRGYGMQMAFWAVALEGGLRYARNGSLPAQVRLLAAMLLANLSVPTLVPLWAVVVALTGTDLMRRKRQGTLTASTRHFAAWAALGLLPMLAGVYYALLMREGGLLVHGTLEGFIPVTLASLSRLVLGTGHPVVLGLVLAFIALGTVAAWRQRDLRSPLSLVVLLLWADVAMRMGMALLLEVNHAEDRAALHMVPLALLAMAYGADALAVKRVAWRWASVLLLALPLRTLLTANVDHTFLWPEQSVPHRFVERIVALQLRAQRPLTIGTYHQLQLALPYATRLQGHVLNLPDVHDHPHGPHDVRIVDERFIDQAREGYFVEDSVPRIGLYLLLPRPSVRTGITAKGAFVQHDPMAEETVVWESPTLPGTGDVLVEFRTALETAAPFTDLRAVVTQWKDGAVRYERTFSLALIRPRWQGETMSLTVRIPRDDEADRHAVRLVRWGEGAVLMGQGEYKVHRLLESLPH